MVTTRKNSKSRAYGRGTFAGLVGLALMAAAARGGALDPFDVSFDPSFRTAYHSRGKIVENRPVFMTTTRAGWNTKDIGGFGKIGFWNFTSSSLTRKRRTVYRRPLNEMDYGLFWTYTWDFGRDHADWEGWGVTTDALMDWITLEGYRHAYRENKTNASIHEYRLQQSLDNPYLTPFYLFRRGIHPNDWFYARVGVKHTFHLTDTLTFTPTFHAEHGDERLFIRRYGERLDGGSYHSGLMALNLILELAWKASANLTFYANVHQFDLTDERLRDKAKAQTAANYRRDLTILALGLRCRF